MLLVLVDHTRLELPGAGLLRRQCQAPGPASRWTSTPCCQLRGCISPRIAIWEHPVAGYSGDGTPLPVLFARSDPALRTGPGKRFQWPEGPEIFPLFLFKCHDRHLFCFQCRVRVPADAVTSDISSSVATSICLPDPRPACGHPEGTRRSAPWTRGLGAPS